MAETDYKNIVNEVIAKFDSLGSADKTSYAGCLVRLAGHDFMDFRDDGNNRGGSDGCLLFTEGDHAGLGSCMQTFSLNAIYANHCTSVSIADFMVIVAEGVMGRAAEDFTSSDPYNAGTTLGKFMHSFKYGRETATQCSWATNLMPVATDGCGGTHGLNAIFVTNIFKNTGREWEFTAAISGAHTLGSAKVANSGFDGHWSDASNSGKFNNDYFKSILFKGWKPELNVNGVMGKNQWKRVDGGKESNHKEMMLDTDMCLAMRNNNQGAGLLAATDANCCSWFQDAALFNDNVLKRGSTNQYCGRSISNPLGP